MSIKLKKTTVIYFAIFGFLFGLFNVVDIRYNLTGGNDIPISWVFNLPAMVVQSTIVDPALNRIGGLPVVKLDKENDPEEKESQKTTKEMVKVDILIDERGLLKQPQTFLLYFPFLSALSWAIIGIVISVAGSIFGLKRVK